MTTNWGEMNTIPKLGRIGGSAWTALRADHAIGIYNVNFSAGGTGRQLDLPKPWTVLGPVTFERFATFTEAIEYAAEQTTPSETQQRLDWIQKQWRAA